MMRSPETSSEWRGIHEILSKRGEYAKTNKEPIRHYRKRRFPCPFLNIKP